MARMKTIGQTSKSNSSPSMTSGFVQAVHSRTAPSKVLSSSLRPAPGVKLIRILKGVPTAKATTKLTPQILPPGKENIQPLQISSSLEPVAVDNDDGNPFANEVIEMDSAASDGDDEIAFRISEWSTGRYVGTMLTESQWKKTYYEHLQMIKSQEEIWRDSGLFEKRTANILNKARQACIAPAIGEVDNESTKVGIPRNVLEAEYRLYMEESASHEDEVDTGGDPYFNLWGVYSSDIDEIGDIERENEVEAGASEITIKEEVEEEEVDVEDGELGEDAREWRDEDEEDGEEANEDENEEEKYEEDDKSVDGDELVSDAEDWEPEEEDE
ncbi:unnamed protein product [Somion occarium]